MGHLIIAFYAIILIFGLITAFFLYNYSRKYDFSFIRPYIIHLLCINCVVLLILLTEYLFLNILSPLPRGSAGSFSYKDLIWLVKRGIIIFSLIGISFTYVKILNCMYGWSYEKLFRIGFNFISIVSVFIFGGIVWTFYYTNQTKTLNLLYQIILGIISMIIISISIFALFKNRNEEKTNIRSRLFYFPVFYLTVTILILMEELNVFGYSVFMLAVILLSVNLFPIIWIRFYVRNSSLNLSNTFLNGLNVQNIITKNNLSDREGEIFELIIKGYSNKQIKEKLYISIHTVRNHIYNLYKKLNVSSRGELYKILRENNNRS